MPFYPRKLKHDFLIDGGLEVTGNTTLTGNITHTGTLTQTGVATFTAAPVFSAGVASIGTVSAQKAAIVMSTGGYLAEHVQSLTGAACLRPGTTAGTAMVGYGLTKVALTLAQATGAANFHLKLSNPVVAGVHKYLVISRATGASTYEVWVSNESSDQTFYGTTADGIKMTTDWASPNPVGFHFVGITTDQWATLTVNGLQSSQWSYTGTTMYAT